MSKPIRLAVQSVVKKIHAKINHILPILDKASKPSDSSRSPTMLSLKFLSGPLKVLATNQLTASVPTLSVITPSKTGSSLLHQAKQDERSLSTGPQNRRLASTNEKMRGLKLSAASLSSEIDLPTPPKKPVTPWIVFVRERKDEILNQHHKMRANELAMILARDWRAMNKDKYEEDYRRRHDEYLKEKENYENSLTDAQRDLIRLNKSLKKFAKTMRQFRKTKPPTLPRNSANLFCQLRSRDSDFREKLKHMKIAKAFSDLFKEYNSLPPEEKEKYLKMQEEDKERFRREFSSWYDSIMADDNLSKQVREEAKSMMVRFKAQNYV